MTATTWNPSDKSANWTLTNGDLTAASGSSANSGVRATNSQTAGKFYWETYTQVNGSTIYNTNGATLLSQSLANTYQAQGGVGVASSGDIYRNGSSISTNIGTTVGQKIYHALDLTAKLYWARTNDGWWNNSSTADPATGVGGIDVSAVFTGGAVAACLASGSVNHTVDAIFDGSLNARAAPAGFLFWDGSTPVDPTPSPVIWDAHTPSLTIQSAGLQAITNQNANGGVFALTSATTGKFYYECLVTANSDIHFSTIGVALLSTHVDSLTAGTGGAGVASAGEIVRNGTNNTALGTTTIGQIVCIAVDLAANLFWARVNGGNWNNSGAANPATGVGGIDMSAVWTGGPVAPAMGCGSAAAGANDFTANFGDSAYSFTVPSGYSNWPTLFTAGPPPTVDPIDGTKILEWNANSISAKRYQEADYDSIWSRGDRIANGLMTSGDYGFGGMFAPMSQAFDNGYGAGLGNGPTPNSGTFAALSAAVWWDWAPWQLELHGIKWLGTESIADDDTIWRIVGGFAVGSVVYESYAREFDNLTIAQTAVDPELGGSLLSRTLDFTPRSPVTWPHYELINSFAGAYGGNRLANELLFKVTHSILDGGDRRSTNGRPDKQVGFAMSSNWTFTVGSGIADPASALFDGKYNRDASSESTKGGADCALIKSVTGSGQHPQITVGEWLEFTFPRKVRFHHLVFNLANGDLETLDSGGNPTFYGKWHWEVSDGGGFTPLGGSWYFSESSEFMVAPGASPAAGFGLTDDGGHLKWRMVLEAGPAFGNDKLLAQIIFHLDDPGNQAVALELHFTDDVDNLAPALLTPPPPDPYTLLFTDGSDDVLSLSLSNTPNPILSVAFSDGASDQLNIFTDLQPAQVVQTFTYATGR
jgi:hypothetical protein